MNKEKALFILIEAGKGFLWTTGIAVGLVVALMLGMGIVFMPFVVLGDKALPLSVILAVGLVGAMVRAFNAYENWRWRD